MRARHTLRTFLKKTRLTIPKRLHKERCILTTLDTLFLDTVSLHHAKNVILGVYAPMAGEVDIRPFLTKFSDSIAFPKVMDKGTNKGMMEFHRVKAPLSDACFEKHPLGFFQPVIHDLVQPSWLLVPCLGFTEELYRLGYGGGYYDAYLNRFPHTKTIGICFEEQKIHSHDFSPHIWDYPLTFIVTEKKLYHS
jgi:5-formyltetrahydrofolate cyclo-ligase